MAVPSTLVRRRDHAREAPRPASGGQAVGGALLVVLVAACGACARVDSGAPNTEPPPAESIPIAASIPIDSAPARRLVDLDSLSAALLDRADTTSPAGRARLEAEIRDWLARLEFGDPELLPEDADPGTHFRPWRGRLLDALGWLAFRTGDLRQAEAALVSAAEQIHNRGDTDGFALHFWHLGRLYTTRGRWRDAADAFLDAEVRGLGARATPDLEAAWRRSRGSLQGLDAARAAERARVEDERRQALIAGSLYQALPAFRWPRRTGAPMEPADLAGRRVVLAAWGPECASCAGYAEDLEPLAARLAARGEVLVGVWLGEDPAAAGPPRRYAILVPEDPESARRRLAIDSLPLLAVVDAKGLIRYRHAGRRAVPPPIEDIVVQLDHLARARF